MDRFAHATHALAIISAASNAMDMSGPLNLKVSEDIVLGFCLDLETGPMGLNKSLLKIVALHH